jgi:hypothetical protein
VSARRVTGALALAGALTVAGCGDSGPPRMSKEAYQRRGDAICTSYLDRIKKLGTPSELSEISPYIAKALPILSETVDRLGTLRPPKALDDEFESYLEAMQATRKRAIDLRNAAARADGGAVEGLLADAARAGSTTDDLARKAELEACVQG